jgi:protein involved in polysaccharide export with SLBB domain
VRARTSALAGLLSVALLAACSHLPECTNGDGVAEYRLGPGDRVRLTVFRHEDLSGEFELDGEGDVALPLAGDILAQNLSARQLENETEIRLREKGYLVDPQVSIEVLTYRPFYILGEVSRPGEYEYASGLTVVKAVSIAGGFTYRADQADIVIERENVGPRSMCSFDRATSYAWASVSSDADSSPR